MLAFVKSRASPTLARATLPYHGTDAGDAEQDIIGVGALVLEFDAFVEPFDLAREDQQVVGVGFELKHERAAASPAARS